MKNVWNFQVFGSQSAGEPLVVCKKSGLPVKYEPLIISLAPVLKSCYFKSILLIDKEDKMEIFIAKNKKYVGVPFFIKLRQID